MQNITSVPKNIIIGFSILAILVSISGNLLDGKAQAAQMTVRKVTVSNSAGGANGVTYTYSSAALPTTATVVRSVDAQACTTASGACTTPSGFSVASSTLLSQPTGLGCTTGWSVSTATAGRLRISNSACATAPTGAVSIPWGNVANPTAQNTTYYLRVNTYSDDTYTTAVDNGVVAASTAQAITLNASVDETLTFCTGTSGITTTSCTGATGSTVNFGTLSPSATSTGVSQMGVGTNATTGYAITVNGSTLSSGANTISALTTQTASSIGTAQFGMNLRANTTPTVGTEPDGSGTASPTSTYNTADQFRFVTGESIASKASADSFRRFHVAYMANASTLTSPGAYSATMTYICTATF